MQRPEFGTAVPVRRYQVGEYTATVLDDIESTGAAEYRYILAMVVEGATHPKLYVVLERNRGAAAREGAYRMRVLGEGIDQLVGASDQWRSPDAFASTALAVGVQLLGLIDETPVRLM